jgi:hypothetical protein
VIFMFLCKIQFSLPGSWYAHQNGDMTGTCDANLKTNYMKVQTKHMKERDCWNM